MRQGPVLAEMEMDGYRPLGAFGQPVHRSYVQLHAAVRQRLGEQCANLFARPQWDERNRRIRWISPIPGEARSWAGLAAEEQAERALDLQIIRSEFENYLSELRAAGASGGGTGHGGGEAFASVLEQALKTPNDGHLHFVGDQPVMTFWGFSELSGARFEPLAAIPPPTAGPVPPVGSKAAVAGGLPVWLQWLLPILLFLLLLALLVWFLWPSDRAAVSEPGATPQAEDRPAIRDGSLPQSERPEGEPPATVEPDATVPPDRVIRDSDGRAYDWRDLRIDGQGRVVDENGEVVEGISAEDLRQLQDLAVDPAAVPGQDAVDDAGTLTDPDAATVPDTGIDAEGVADTDADADAGQGTDATDPAVPEPGVDQGAETDAAADTAAGEDAGGDPAAGDAGEDPGALVDEPGAALQLPEAAVEQSENAPVPPVRPGEDQAATQAPPVSVEFLRGKWRGRSQLTDEKGNRIDQTYEFDNSGKGQSVIRRADGTRCTAPAQAAMKNGKLHIEELENLSCPDGQRFEKSETVCERDASGRTRCKGNGFDVQIERPK